MTEISLRVEGFPEMRRAVQALRARVVLATREGVALGAHVLEDATKRNMDGRPGPTVQTGTLRRSVHVTGPIGAGAVWTATVAPTAVYARRIELGFMGMHDSLGRLFHQPAYPYLAPAVRDSQLKVLDVLRASWARALIL